VTPGTRPPRMPDFAVPGPSERGAGRHATTGNRMTNPATDAMVPLEAGCSLIAEGIETEAERTALRSLAVSLGQGYLLGRPAPLPN
jgi:hypothetical protein